MLDDFIGFIPFCIISEMYFKYECKNICMKPSIGNHFVIHCILPHASTHTFGNHSGGRLSSLVKHFPDAKQIYVLLYSITFCSKRIMLVSYVLKKIACVSNHFSAMALNYIQGPKFTLKHALRTTCMQDHYIPNVTELHIKATCV